MGGVMFSPLVLARWNRRRRKTRKARPEARIPPLLGTLKAYSMHRLATVPNI